MGDNDVSNEGSSIVLITNVLLLLGLLIMGEAILAPCKKSYDKPRQHIKKQRHYFAGKGLSSQSYGFFQLSYLDVRIGPQRKLSAKELMLSNCGTGEDS